MVCLSIKLQLITTIAKIPGKDIVGLNSVPKQVTVYKQSGVEADRGTVA